MNKDNIKNLQNEISELKLKNSQLTKEIAEIKKSRGDKLPLEKTKQIMSFLENSTSSIMLKDTAGEYLLINQHIANLLGIPHDKFIGKKDRDLFSPELASQFEEEDRLIISTGKPLRSEHEYRLHDKTRFFMTTRFPLFDLSGTIYAIGMVSTEITELKEAQNELDSYREQLEKIVSKRTAELKDTNSILTARVIELQAAKEEIKKLNDTLEDKINARTLELSQTSEALEQSNETIRETQEKLILSEKMASLGTMLTEATHEINTPVGISITTASHIEKKQKKHRNFLPQNSSKPRNWRNISTPSWRHLAFSPATWTEQPT